jgi:hypothetical protein
MGEASGLNEQTEKILKQQ